MYKLSKYNVVIEEKDNQKLIFNSRNQALCWVSSDLYNDISNGLETEVNSLIKLGVIVDSDRDEFAELMFEKNSFIFNANPTQVGFVIAPTMACNMRCRYCFENNVEDKVFMSRHTADDVISFIKKQIDGNKAIKQLHIRWFGGEPCLAIDTIEYISKSLIGYCDQKAIMYNSLIVSNGALLNRQMASRLKDVRVKRVQLTIDGMEDYYSDIKGVKKEIFHNVVNNICEIYNLIKVVIRINVSENNIDQIEKLSTYLLKEKELNKKIWIYYELVRNFKHNEEKNSLTPYEFEQLKASIMKKLTQLGCIDSLLHYLPQRNIFSCGAMQCKSATIGPQGELYRCDNGLGKNEFIIGDCKNGFARNNADCRFLLADYKEGCEDCCLLPICGGGCLEDRIIEKNKKDCDAVRMKLVNDIDIYIKYMERREYHGSD